MFDFFDEQIGWVHLNSKHPKLANKLCEYIFLTNVCVKHHPHTKKFLVN